MSTGSETLVLFMCLDAKKFVLLSFTSLIKTVKCESFNQITAQGCKKFSSGWHQSLKNAVEISWLLYHFHTKQHYWFWEALSSSVDVFLLACPCQNVKKNWEGQLHLRMYAVSEQDVHFCLQNIIVKTKIFFCVCRK